MEPASRDGKSVHRNLQCECCRVSPIGAGCIPAGRRLARGGRILSHRFVAAGSCQLIPRVLRLELVRYDAGIDPYIDVVVAQTTLLAEPAVSREPASAGNDSLGSAD